MKRIWILILCFFLCSCGNNVGTSVSRYTNSSHECYTKNVYTDIPTTKGVFYLKKGITLKEVYLRYFFEGCTCFSYYEYYVGARPERNRNLPYDIKFYGDNCDKLNFTVCNDAIYVDAYEKTKIGLIALNISTEYEKELEVKVSEVSFLINGIEFKMKTELIFKIVPEAEFVCDTNSNFFLPIYDVIVYERTYDYASEAKEEAIIRVNTDIFNSDFGKVTIESFSFDNISNLKITDLTWKTSYTNGDDSILSEKIYFEWDQFFKNGRFQYQIETVENLDITLDYYTIVFNYSFEVEPTHIYTAVVRTDLTHNSLLRSLYD